MALMDRIGLRLPPSHAAKMSRKLTRGRLSQPRIEQPIGSDATTDLASALAAAFVLVVAYVVLAELFQSELVAIGVALPTAVLAGWLFSRV